MLDTRMQACMDVALASKGLSVQGEPGTRDLGRQVLEQLDVN